MKKFPIWLLIVFILSLIPCVVYLNWFQADDYDSIIGALAASPLLILVFLMKSPLLAVSVVLIFIIQLYFICKFVYGLLHKFNVKMSDRAKYVIPSMLGISLITFMISVYQIKH